MIGHLKNYIVNDELMDKVVFYVIAFTCMAILVPSEIYAIVIHNFTIPQVLMVIGIAIVFILLIVLKKKRQYQNGIVTLLIFINCVLTPMLMMFSGGTQSVAIMWFVAGIVACMCVLRDRRLIYTTAISFVAALITIVLAYVRADYVTDFRVTETGRFLSIFFSFAGVILILSLLMVLKTLKIHYQNEEYAKQKIELESALRTQSAFLANMSHEIRTPINTIIGLNEMTLREDISDEVFENASHIQSASKMLLSVINDVLDISKIESGKMDIVSAQYELGQMLSDIVNMNWVRANDKKLEFTVVVAEELPSMLWGDEVRIKQIVNNILSNAIKYTKEGFVRLVITGTVAGANDVRLRIMVEDSGIGIKKEDIGKLFDNFTRVDEVNTKGIEGTGLGLAITKQLVDLMGGTITVESVYHKGSSFVVEFPQGIVDSSPIGHVNLLNQSRERGTTYEKHFEASAARVLVVDDNEMNLMVVQKLLRETKINVHQANSGVRALELCLANSYDVILMDHMMPEMDGVEALQKIRAQEGGLNKETPIIALTANAMSGAEEKYQKLGFSSYLAKPVSGALLEAMLLKYLPTDVVNYMDETEVASYSGDVKYVAGRYLKPITISIDAVGDMPKILSERLDIKKINYYVETDLGRFIDGVEIFGDSAIEFMKRGGKARAVCPSIEDYEAFFAERLRESRYVIHLCLSSNQDVGYYNALKAAESFSSVTVIDTEQLSSGVSVMAVEAALMAERTDDVEAIIEHVNNVKEKVISSFTVETPDFLYHNGRISKALYYPLKYLGARICLEFKHKKMRMIALYGGSREQFIKKYIRAQLAGRTNVDTSRIFITGSGCMSAEKPIIEQEVRKYQAFKEIYFSEASSSIAMNSGPGTFGLNFKKV